MSLKKVIVFLKNQYVILAVITLVALFIRMLNIDKPYGLWYDEMLTYTFSSSSFPFGLIKTLSRFDFHMPLYYVYVHFWMKFFGSGDTVLRYSSLIWGVMIVPAFFWLGKTYKSKNLGYLLASVACLNPILIYFSQEFRFYSMLVFFSILTLIAILKLTEEPEKKYLWLFGVSNLIILYIYTMGLIFVSLEFLALFIHFYFFKKDFFRTFIKFSSVFFICAIPYLILLHTYSIASSQLIIYPFSFSKIDANSIISLINDWFSPFLTNQYGISSKTYEKYLQTPFLTGMLYIFSATAICFIIGFFSGLRKVNKKLIYLLIILFGFLGAEIVLAMTGHLNLYTKYTLICFPILLLISVDGIITIKSSVLKKSLLFIIFLIYIFNAIDYKNMPAFYGRVNGYKILTDGLNKNNLTKNDYILYPGGAIMVQKYLSNVHVIDFDLLSALLLDKRKDYAYKIFDKDFVLTTNKDNVYEKLVPYLENKMPGKTLERFVNSQVNLIPANGRMFLLEDDVKDGLGPDQFIKLIKLTQEDKELEKEYKKSVFTLLTNKINNDMLIILDNNSSLKFVQKMVFNGPGRKSRKWFVYVYKKI